MKDYVDTNLDDWRRERPDIDTSAWELTQRLVRLSMHLSHAERVYEPYQLHKGLVDVLGALRRAGPLYQMSPTKLCQAVLISSATMTSRLDKLAHEAMIERVPDPSDRRGVLVHLTPQGRAVIDDIVTKAFDTRRQELQALSNEERAILVILLRKLLVSIEGPVADAGVTAGGERSAASHTGLRHTHPAVKRALRNARSKRGDGPPRCNVENIKAVR